MFLGHFAVGFAAKRVAPRTSLGFLIAAPLALDLLWPIFLLVGVEHVRYAPHVTAWNSLDFYDYPLSHSLLMSIVWGLLFGGVYWARTRRTRGAVTLGVLVVSHWVLDWVTHRPDLPLVPWGGPKVGLGLWNSVAGTLVLELAMFAVGVWIYAASTRARDAVGRWSFVAYIVVLLALYLSDRFNAPATDMRALAWFALAGWIFPFWAAWLDRHRAPTVAERGGPAVPATG